MAKKKKYADKVSLSLPKAKNQRQSELIDALNHKEMVVTLGPAGVGKSFLPACFAGYFYKKGKVNKIIVTRPNIPTGKSLGYFPGMLEEKMAPWVRPILDTLEDYLSKGAIETMMKSGSLEIVPLETIRGRSWSNSFIILDEAQNCSKEEIKAFVTRIGEGCTTVINGDISQSDLKETNGLKYLLRLIEESPLLSEKVQIVEFKSADIVRSGLCQLFVRAFEDFD